MTRARGFSMLELVVTIVIVGIVMAVAVPRFTDNEAKATWFHEQVKATVRYAQRQAVAQRRCVFVEVPTTTTIQLRYGDTSCVITATILTQPGGTAAYTLTAPSGVTIASSAGTFSFNGLGRPSATSNITVGSRTVTVNAETGLVQ